MHVEHPQTTLRFLDGFSFRQSASDFFPSLQLASHEVCSPNAQRNAKCVHRIKTYARNVT